MGETSTFCWNELLTSDVDRCRAFYSELLGWKPLAVPMGPIQYTMFQKGRQPVAGMMALPPGAGTPHWLSYVAVADVDANVHRVKSLGGAILASPTDVPGVGRFAIVSDPAGAVFSIIKLQKHSVEES